MQIVRGCDTKRNVLVYMVYSDTLIEGSPKLNLFSPHHALGSCRSGGKMRRLGGALKSCGAGGAGEDWDKGVKKDRHSSQ